MLLIGKRTVRKSQAIIPLSVEFRLVTSAVERNVSPFFYAIKNTPERHPSSPFIRSIVTHCVSYVHECHILHFSKL